MSKVCSPPLDVALLQLTSGRFDPRHPALVRALEEPREGLVSVCAVTTTSWRGHFHPLLYESFRRQTHDRKELLVVDVGEEPSEFLRQKAREDDDVFYFSFPDVEDAQGEEEQEGRGAGPAATNHTWSLGLKRCVCARLARGAIIAQWDDGAMYAPEYLSHMVEELDAAVREKWPAASAREGTAPALVELVEWHTLNSATRELRKYDARHAEEHARHDHTRGHGFICTRAAWEMQSLPNKEAREGSELRECLLVSRDAAVRRACLPPQLECLVAHVKLGHTGAEGEAGTRQLGTGWAAVPRTLRAMMPYLPLPSQERELPLRNSKCLRWPTEDPPLPPSFPPPLFRSGGA